MPSSKPDGCFACDGCARCTKDCCEACVVEIGEAGDLVYCNCDGHVCGPAPDADMNTLCVCGYQRHEHWSESTRCPTNIDEKFRPATKQDEG